MLDFNVNYWAVLVAAIINMVVGATWYMPGVFGKTWAKLLGKKMSDMKGSGGMGYAVTTVAALVQNFVLAALIVTINVTTLANGLWLGFAVWIGFAVSATISDYVFAQRGKKLFLLNQGYYLVVLLINGALLALWR